MERSRAAPALEARPVEEISGGIHVRQPNPESAIFWIKMFTENLVQSVEGDLMNLDEKTPAEELEILTKQFSDEPKDSPQTTSLRSNSS